MEKLSRSHKIANACSQHTQFTVIQFSLSIQMVALSWTGHCLLHLWRRRREITPCNLKFYKQKVLPSDFMRSAEEGTWFHRFDYIKPNLDREVLSFFFWYYYFYYCIQYFSDLRTRFFSKHCQLRIYWIFQFYNVANFLKNNHTANISAVKITVFRCVPFPTGFLLYFLHWKTACSESLYFYKIQQKNVKMTLE